MKKYFMIILCLLLWGPVAQAVEVTDKELIDHYQKGKTAFAQKQWIDAIKHFFVYRELAALGNASADLSTVDGYIKKAEANAGCESGPVNVREGGGGGIRGGR